MYHQNLDNMKDQPDNDAEAIETRELESGKGSEGHKSTSIKQPEEIKEHDKPLWNTIFTISCAIAIFVDPLYCYAPVIHVEKTYKCLRLDRTFLWTYIGLRSAVDVFYAIDFVSSCKKTFGDFWTRSGRKTVPGSKGEKREPVSWCMKTFGTFWTRSSQKTEVLYLILVSLPLPEVLILSSICSNWYPTYALIISTPIQYSLRIYHIYVTLRLRRPNKTRVKWLKAVLDYLPFVLASHLFGALWYRLAVQRLVDCWKSHFRDLLQDPESKRSRHFMCTDITPLPSSLAKWDELCPVQEANREVFDFGIYLNALQSNVTGSTNVVQRMSQSFWWALRNLSSFGSNLETSVYTMEIFLSVMISISGMALFLVYLNARVQEAHSSRKKKKTEPDIDLWLCKNDIQHKDLKTAIMKNIHKLGENKDIDLQNMLSILPVNDKNRIIQQLCLASLKKVPVLENIPENILIAICEHLKPVTYTEDSYIVQEGRPLVKMLFIVEGLAWTYTTGNIDVGTLKRGDFYGEEVLTWAFQSPSFSGLPISTRTVMSEGKIEAFALRAGDLKSVVCSFGGIGGI